MIEPAARTVHLWWEDVDRIDHEEAAGLLDREERRRHDGFRFGRDRSRFAGRRALLRRVLAAYTGLGPAEVPIRVESDGKPFSPALAGATFSCSSSRALAVVAVAPVSQLGVDLEHRPDGTWEAFPVRRYLSEDEQSGLAELPEVDATRRAAMAWVVKEAIAKAVGAGTMLPLTEIVLEGSPDAPSVRMDGAWEPHAGSWHARVVASDGFRVVAIAADEPWDNVVAMDWRDAGRT